MNASQIVDATLARADAALTTRTIDDLSLAQQSLIGCLDWAAKQTGDEVLVRNVLKSVTEELKVQRNG